MLQAIFAGIRLLDLFTIPRSGRKLRSGTAMPLCMRNMDMAHHAALLMHGHVDLILKECQSRQRHLVCHPPCQAPWKFLCVSPGHVPGRFVLNLAKLSDDSADGRPPENVLIPSYYEYWSSGLPAPGTITLKFDTARRFEAVFLHLDLNRNDQVEITGLSEHILQGRTSDGMTIVIQQWRGFFTHLQVLSYQFTQTLANEMWQSFSVTTTVSPFVPGWRKICLV